MACSTTEVTNLFYTVARGWISQTDPSVSIQFESTHSFADLGGEILSTIHRKHDGDNFENGVRRLILISDEYSVTPAARGPQKLTANDIGQIAFMASSHFFSALGEPFGPLFFVPFFRAVCLRMQIYYNAEMVAAKNSHL